MEKNKNIIRELWEKLNDNSGSVNGKIKRVDESHSGQSYVRLILCWF